MTDDDYQRMMGRMSVLEEVIELLIRQSSSLQRAEIREAMLAIIDTDRVSVSVHTEARIAAAERMHYSAQ